MEALKSPAEHRVVLPNVEWSTYAKVLDGRGEGRTPRLVYDQGSLEVMSPSSEHERIAYFLSQVVAVYAEEHGIDLLPVGTLTLSREDLGRGVEPDACFYVREDSVQRVRGKQRINLDASDPAPDLLIEVDITSPSVERLPIYAALGVGEVWRYVGENEGRVDILSPLPSGEYDRPLPSGEYDRLCESSVLAGVCAENLSSLVRESSTLPFGAWMRRARKVAT